MSSNPFYLLTTRRFLPLFITQFLGAFNDNLLKSALVVLITYVITKPLLISPAILVTLSGSLLILPMILFSSNAGSIADKFEKSLITKIIKLSEIVLMLLASIGFMQQNVYLLMLVLLFIGLHSTYFGPIKYSILPTHLKENELIGGTALIEMGTFLAILLGNILGILSVAANGATLVSILVVGVAIVGFISSCFIPKAPSGSPDLKISWHMIKDSIQLVKTSAKNPVIHLSILGISWFWLIGFIYLTQFPSYAKEFVHSNERVFILFLSTFSIGIGLGSLLCSRLLKGRIEAIYVPLATFGMSLFTIDLYYATLNFPPIADSVPLLSIIQFIQYGTSWRILMDMLFIAICGGIYIVPLYSLLQHRAENTHKARVIASNNIVNSLFMAVGACVTVIFLKLSLTIPQIFLVLAFLNFIVMIQSCRLLPGAFIKSIFRIILSFLYKVEVKGIENFYLAGERVVITPNHTSFLDGILLGTFLPHKLSFALYKGYLDKWWIKPIKLFVEAFGLESENPYMIKSIVKLVRQNKKIVIFPEGRITVTGALMKVYEGPGLIADKADAFILPVLIEGAQYSPFSRLKGRVRTKWFPKITITCFKPEKIAANTELTGKKRRQSVGERVYQVMSNMMYLSQDIQVTLFQSLLDAREVHGTKHHIIEDGRRKPLNYNRLILSSLIIGEKLKKISKPYEPIGVLLPTSIGAVVTLFGLNAHERVCAFLNFSTGVKNVVLACETAHINLVCTSKEFIEKAQLQEMEQALITKGIKLVYLEDVKKRINLFNKIHALIANHLPSLFKLTSTHEKANQPAIILFTSGSEGTPKAVVLSSTNIQANKSQIASRVDFSRNDVVLNTLPIFHSFGLTGGTLLPLLYGMRVFLYPSPLHYRVIPDLAYDINATILFGTNTFLAGYARYAHAYDFYSIRYVFAGGEKLKEENRRMWSDKFGVRVFEGYGVTETSPIIAVNTPMHNRPGSVGQILPGIEHELTFDNDYPKGGRLLVKGANVMMGYMLHDSPGVIQPPLDGWYDTGDIVSIDDDGYLYIEGRAKRFAKIGGEMISLGAIEDYLEKLWPEYQHAVISINDERKGEQIVLLTTHPTPDKSTLIEFVLAQGLSELSIPKTIKIIDEIPLLGSGKINYIAIKALFE